MKQFFIIVCFIFTITVISCSEREEPVLNESRTINETLTESRGDTWTPAEAIRNVKDFLEMMSNSRSYTKEIKNVLPLKRSAVANAFPDLDLSSVDTSIDTLLYFVNFDNEEGFAIAGANKNSEPLFAIVESGNYSAEKLNATSSTSTVSEDMAIRGFIPRILYLTYVTHDLEIIDPTPAPIWWRIEKKIDPLLVTKWGQGGEYNQDSFGRYCPNKTTGCVITAAAQIICYYKAISETERYDEIAGKMVLNWDQIISDSQYFGRSFGWIKTNSLEQVANLCRYLGDNFNAKYHPDYTTSAETNDYIHWMRNNTKLYANTVKDYNEDKVIQTIDDGNLVYALGRISKHNGHAWIYDGYIKMSDNYNHKKYYIHCNWGWSGKSDGYFLSRIMDTIKGPAYDDEGDPTNNPDSDGYKFYKLQISTILPQDQ